MYMKVDSISKALRDGEKCVELAPKWAKGYNRLAAAQHGLKRFDQALQTVQKGLEIDPNNESLWTLNRLIQEAINADQKERYAKAAREREIEEARLRQLDQEMAEAARKAEEVSRFHLNTVFSVTVNVVCLFRRDKMLSELLKMQL